ncbi:MAG TPA: outer membrane beta-barrel protein [Anaeromyxobacteraceae bacterium]|nr:outer membrane beta-barrel protein [Anaeromyxobacteraceae bacterium]
MSSLTTRMALAALLLGSASPAWAGAGNGIRFGGSEGRLHPFLELEGRYDSNVYVNAFGTQASDFIVHTRPGLTLEVPGELATVELTAQLDWAKYLGADDAATKDLSKLYAESQLRVGVNEKGTVALLVEDLFRRSDRPQALSFNAGVISNFNDLSLAVPWHPGGGALAVTVNGGWSLETYQQFFSGFVCSGSTSPLCNTDNLSKLGYNELRGGLEVRWKFLPRTAVVVSGGAFKRLPNDTAFSLDAAGYRAQAGLTGLITPHVAATIEAGYGSTFSTTPSLGTWLLTADAEWLPTETASVKVGYAHDYAVDPGLLQTALYDVHRVFLDAKQQLAGRFTLKAKASLDRLGFAGSSADTVLLRAEPSVEAEATRWLRFALAYAFTDRASSNQAGFTLPARDYSKSEVWLKAVFTY